MHEEQSGLTERLGDGRDETGHNADHGGAHPPAGVHAREPLVAQRTAHRATEGARVDTRGARAVEERPARARRVDGGRKHEPEGGSNGGAGKRGGGEAGERLAGREREAEQGARERGRAAAEGAAEGRGGGVGPREAGEGEQGGIERGLKGVQENGHGCNVERVKREDPDDAGHVPDDAVGLALWTSQLTDGREGDGVCRPFPSRA
jgi:hypothetical protein